MRKCRTLTTKIDMKPLLVLFDVAMSRLLTDKNMISGRCANMTLLRGPSNSIFIYTTWVLFALYHDVWAFPLMWWGVYITKTLH